MYFINETLTKQIGVTWKEDKVSNAEVVARTRQKERQAVAPKMFEFS